MPGIRLSGFFNDDPSRPKKNPGRSNQRGYAVTSAALTPRNRCELFRLRFLNEMIVVGVSSSVQGQIKFDV